MLKKTVLIVVSIMLIVFGASLSFANQIDGMASGTGPALPAGIQASINPGGIGDSLLYSYYNVRGNLNLFNVINTDSVDGAKVRVVFRSAKTSKECLDFSVCLSKGDVWTAYLLDDGTTARVFAFDTDTITGPTIPSSGQPFKFGSYPPFTLTGDDCREGYFEVVGMSSIPGYDKNSSATSACAVGEPASNCIRTEAACLNWDGNGEGDDRYDAQNSLMGNNTIIDLSTLATYSLNATAIVDTAFVSFDVPGGAEISIPYAMGIGRNSAIGCDEADFIFMKSNVLAPFDLLKEIGGETELVLTFPTRLVCHGTTGDLDMFDGKTLATDDTTWLTYCSSIVPHAWDDKEHELTITDFSPSVGTCLPWEVNVIKLGGSNIWNTTVGINASVGSFTLGWIDIDLYNSNANHAIDYNGFTMVGLPVVGQTSQSFVSGSASYMLPVAAYTARLAP